MDAVMFLQERSRMYKSGAVTPGYDYDPVVAVKVVEEWSAAHPRKTRQDVFLEKWPNVAVSEDGVIKIRPCNLDVNAKKECLGVTCDYCRREFWMQEVE